LHASGLPLVHDGVDASHPKVRELVAWCEGMVWSSPERHGSMTGLMKTQIDWVPPCEGVVGAGRLIRTRLCWGSGAVPYMSMRSTVTPDR
jgi:hypothetical protein